MVPLLSAFKSTTSAIRFTKNGLWTQELINQILKIGFHLGIPHATMKKIYEQGLKLKS